MSATGLLEEHCQRRDWDIIYTETSCNNIDTHPRRPDGYNSPQEILRLSSFGSTRKYACERPPNRQRPTSGKRYEGNSDRGNPYRKTAIRPFLDVDLPDR